MLQCMAVILKHCCVKDPSWSELSNFTAFLNYQLRQCKESAFSHVPEDLPGFRGFMTRFLIQMSKDFATRSVVISDESQGKGYSMPRIEDRNRWENAPHPYVVFNQDGQTVSFFGFFIDRSLRILDEKTGEILLEKVISRPLYDGLIRNGVEFNVSLDDLTRAEKRMALLTVLGISTDLFDDESYELTSDNMLKMMAIWMRFKCNISVIINGETGCGKTRLIRYLYIIVS